MYSFKRTRYAIKVLVKHLSPVHPMIGHFKLTKYFQRQRLTKMIIIIIFNVNSWHDDNYEPVDNFDGNTDDDNNRVFHWFNRAWPSSGTVIPWISFGNTLHLNSFKLKDVSTLWKRKKCFKKLQAFFIQFLKQIWL